MVCDLDCEVRVLFDWKGRFEEEGCEWGCLDVGVWWILVEEKNDKVCRKWKILVVLYLSLFFRNKFWYLNCLKKLI